MSSLRMTSINSPRSETGCERQQRDIPCLLDSVGEAALVRRANARNPPRNDLTPLGDKSVQQLYVLVVDIVDLLDAEAAHFLSPEVLLFLCGDGFIAAGRPLPRASRSSPGFCHGLGLPRHTGHGRRW